MYYRDGIYHMWGEVWMAPWFGVIPDVSVARIRMRFNVHFPLSSSQHHPGRAGRIRDIKLHFPLLLDNHFKARRKSNVARTSDGIPTFRGVICIGIGGSTRVPQIQQLYTVHLVIFRWCFLDLPSSCNDYRLTKSCQSLRNNALLGARALQGLPQPLGPAPEAQGETHQKCLLPRNTPLLQ